MKWIALACALFFSIACDRGAPTSTRSTAAPSNANSTPSSPPVPRASARPYLGPPSALIKVTPRPGPPPKILLFMAHGGVWFTRPRFALYEDGRVLFSRSRTDRSLDLSAQLNEAQTTALAERLITESFVSLPLGRHPQGPAGDGFVEIMARHKGRWKYAVFKRDKRMPPGFAQTLESIETFDAPEATPYRPEKILVHFGFPKSELPPVPWPSELPPVVGRINASKGYGVDTVNGTHEGLVDSIAGSGKDVLVDGKPYSIQVEREPLESTMIFEIRSQTRHYRRRNRRR